MPKRICLIVFLFAFSTTWLHAAEEPYVNMLKGNQLTPGSSFTVTDEKIRDAGTNNFTVLSVDNILSFEIDFYAAHHLYTTPFTCTANLTIEAYDRFDTAQKLSEWPKTIDLQVRYSAVEGDRYKGIALYKFKDAHKFKVTVNSISSPELGSTLPDIFLLKGTTIVHDRKYTLQPPLSTATTIYQKGNGILTLQWNPGDYSGAEMFDLEYTFIDKHSFIADRLKNAFASPGSNNGPFQVPTDTLNLWFKNNNTRVTLTSPSYTLNLSYDSGYVLFRLRGVQITLPPDQLRLTTIWNYQAREDGANTQNSGIVFTDGHEQNLNWQYSATFAEEGKRKEVLSYFDGSLKSRQAVTLNNSDNRSVVQESVYDDIGRPVVNILPSPAIDSTLHYFRLFNRNLSGDAFSFRDINYVSCGTTVGPLSMSSGTSQYYSPQNPFTNFIHRNYIPDAAGYPYTVTEYTPDNTGRIKRQGGVGETFQLKHGHETSYFYGKPNQPELDRLFGTEVGDASHYLKNMVVDPNGQVSVSYVDANGKTIATALAGAAPANLQPLPSNSAGAVIELKSELIAPKNFSKNATDYSLAASSTFLAPVPGDYKFNYSVDPLRLDVTHGPNGELTICNTCYYDLLITIKDGCDSIVQSKNIPAGFVFDTSCAAPTVINDSFTVNLHKVGEYYATYELRVSKSALDFYDSVHVQKNTDLKKLNHFLLSQLQQTDFTGCYNNCESCKAELGEKEDFNKLFKGLYSRDAVPFGETDSLWVNGLYDSLYVHCQSLQPECTASSPCDDRLALLKTDVSTNGQYALLDSTWQYGTNLDGDDDSTLVFSFRNDGTNILYNYSLIDFRDEAGKLDSAINTSGALVPVKQLSQDEFVKNWKKAWADSLVTRHPEYCYYLWCLANPGSYAFDEMIQDLDDADSAIHAGYFDAKRKAFDTLLYYDPFFNSGLGAPLKERMRDSLRLFSRTLLRYSVPDKTILEFIDVALYCNNQYNGWQSCLAPDSSCRSVYQEWLLYRNLYLNLKRKFYEEARRASDDPMFANCTNCYIGKDVLHLNSTDNCDSLDSVVQAFQQFRSGINFDQVAGNKVITQSANELIRAANALVEARSTYPKPEFTEDFCFDGTDISSEAKLHAVRLYQSQNTFHAIAPLSLQSNQRSGYLFPELANNSVLPGDFCKGSASTQQLNDKYYGVTIMGLDSSFQTIWSVKNSTAFAYYGTSRPLDKYLPSSAPENHTFLYEFIRMDGYYPTCADYYAARAQASRIPLDSILHVRNLRYAFEKLPSDYNDALTDNFNFGFLKVTLDMVNGASIDAHMRAGYDDNYYLLYKEQNDEYSADCRKAFTAYFNRVKSTAYSYTQIDSLFRASCGKSPAACIASKAFTDSTCNYSCPGGVYVPADRKGISFFIQYGNPNIAPSDTPAGYGNSQFYNVFNLQTGLSSSCRFFNVWVCVFDSTGLGRGGNTNTYSSVNSCPENPQAQVYKDKIRRYPDYVNTDGLINQVLSNNPNSQSTENATAVIEECKSTCEAQADNWLAALSKCTADSTKLSQLRTAFVQICQAGCAAAKGGNGTSSVPAGSAPYNSFEEAIVGILGAGSLSDSCTAELINTPYPYDKQPFASNQLIYSTNYDICIKVQQYKSQYTASGYSGSFHQYLQQTLKIDYQLDSADLDNLIRSCTQCNGILKEPLLLPIAFEPNGRPCLTCSKVQDLLSSFTAKYHITETNPRYETLLTNYFNHSLGFSLTYVDYKDYLDSCTAHPSNYAVLLCDQPVSPEVDNSILVDNNCTLDLFHTALENAYMEYNTYMDSVHKAFREAYMTKCMNVQARLNMTADLYEYHYTLYYYDQSGNLVKTIPPEGVKLLTPTQLADVVQYRKLKTEGCYQYSDSILFNNNGQILFPLTNSPQFENGAYAIEAQLNLISASDQVILSRLQEQHLDSGKNAYKGFLVSIANNKLSLQFFGLGADSQQRTITATSKRDASALLSMGNWNHVLIERTQNTVIPIRVFVNGSEIVLTFADSGLSINNPDFSTTATLVVGSQVTDSLSLSSKLKGSIKNLRIYNRLLTASEIYQNAFNPCQLPASANGLIFWAPLNDATNNQVKDLALNNAGTLSGFTWQPFAGVFPDHRLPTIYVYNSLNQVIKQNSPDGGASNFWYDRLGRLTVSQNAEQKNASNSDPSNRYSYTRYDDLGRITEVGEKTNVQTDIATVNTKNDDELKAWLDYSGSVNKQVTKTLYDEPLNFLLQSTSNSRKRVVASVYLENQNDSEGDSTLYSYDVSGNVKTLLQHVKALVAADPDNGKKRIDYDYDLVSGKVNKVSYQQGRGDQFFYKYGYDAENRVVSSQSSRDGLVWMEDARYRYYLHGPLARTELGHYKVQGVDYAYTLQGWLKGINSDALASATEMGQDGEASSLFSKVSKDALAFKLGYFTSDFKAIGDTTAPAFDQRVYTAPGSLDATGNQLFNGNISFTMLALSKLNAGATVGYSYGYDQLNRLVEMRQHQTSGAWSNSNIIPAYSESIAYDANGNILKYLRRGANTVSNPLDMDSLTYQYNRDADGRLANNRLNYVRDAVNSSNYTVDIDNQAGDNYSYDRIGNLIKDNAENISGINWTVYGKIKSITKAGTAAAQIGYGYDPGGNRTVKTVDAAGDVTKTFYVRDAQGNVLGVYTKKNNDPIRWNEQHLYGSSRLGMWRWDTLVPSAAPVVQNENQPIFDSLLLGSRAYELTNHLGNVLATVSDKKIGVDINSDGVVDYYIGDVVSANDYYPFGMTMPGRQFSVGNGYRYGFNGQEHSFEQHDNSYTAEFWEYDARLGRRWNKDPKSDVSLSLYSAFSGNPILFSDPLGDTTKIYGNAEVTNTTLLRKGGVNESAGKAIFYKDAQINPVYAKDGNSLVGYNVYDKTNSSLRHPVLQLESDADLANFKENYKWQFGGAQLYYANGEPSEGFKKMSASLDVGSFKLAIEGAKQENKEFWSDPQRAIPTLVAWGHAGIAYAEGSIFNNASNSVSTTIRTQKQAAQHTVGGLSTVGKSTMNSLADAQTVLDALHAGKGRVILMNPSQNRVLFYYNKVQGNFVHQGNSTPSSLFMIKGSSNGATVVPVNPIKIK